jgi:hypothetical protein
MSRRSSGFPHLTAYRKLWNVQILGRFAKVQFSSYREDVLQLSEGRDHGYGVYWGLKPSLCVTFCSAILTILL